VTGLKSTAIGTEEVSAADVTPGTSRARAATCSKNRWACGSLSWTKLGLKLIIST
jgi:hypothetical protein